MKIYITNCKKKNVIETRHLLGWVDVVVGDPKPSEKHSSSELRNIGFVGLYRTSDKKFF